MARHPLLNQSCGRTGRRQWKINIILELNFILNLNTLFQELNKKNGNNKSIEIENLAEENVFRISIGKSKYFSLRDIIQYSFKGICFEDSINEELFNKSKFNQTLVFTATHREWFDDAETKGALCFSYNNYENKIENIKNLCHFKIDLSAHFQSWGVLNPLSIISFNEIILSDNYILTHKFLMDKNIIAVLKLTWLFKVDIPNWIVVWQNLIKIYKSSITI